MDVAPLALFCFLLGSGDKYGPPPHPPTQKLLHGLYGRIEVGKLLKGLKMTLYLR